MTSSLNSDSFKNYFIYGDSCTRPSRQILKFKHEKIKKICRAQSSTGQFMLDDFRNEIHQLMERSEQVVRLITHVCTQKLSGVFRVIQRRFMSYGTFHKCCDEATQTSDELSCHCELNHKSSSCCHKYRNYVCQSPSSSNPRCCNWRQHHKTRKWTLLQDWARGSGAGPPNSKNYLNKHTKQQTPSFTTNSWLRLSSKSVLTTFLLLVAFLTNVAESCSSRSTPKPRPSSPTLRPNVTFQTYACPPAYAAWFCLNGATCFTVKIQDAILYNCECAEGYMGPRCEFKDLDGSYLPARERVLLETASIAGGACIAIILVFIVLFAMYVFVHRDREKRSSFDNPYNDQRPLGDPYYQGSEYICTIIPVMAAPVHKPHVARETEPPPQQNCEGWKPKGIYLVRELSTCSLCTCEKRDISGHICLHHSKNFIIPANVPNFV